MNKITTTITQRGQVTNLESAYGAVKPSRKPEDFDEASRAAKQAKAEKTAQE